MPTLTLFSLLTEILTSTLSCRKIASNIRVIKKENKCFDLGSIGQVLMNNSELLLKYKRFILMNATIRGPFFPRWAVGCWTDFFLNRLNEKVKLVGITHNCVQRGHVQSMIVATDDVGIKILLNGTITPEEEKSTGLLYTSSLRGLNTCPETYYKAINAEISLTNLITDASYQVDVLASQAGVKGYIDRKCPNGDSSPVKGFNNHPYETIFVKVSKYAYDTITVDTLTKWHNSYNYTSWEACKNFKKT